MLRKLNEADRKALYEYLNQEPEINLFMLGDMENYGLETDFLEFWGQIDRHYNFKAVLMRYHNVFVHYATDNFDVENFSAILKMTDPKILSGKKEVIDKFRDYIKPKSERITYFCKLDNDKSIKEVEHYGDVHITTMEDVPLVWGFVTEIIDEFTEKTQLKSHMDVYAKGATRGFHIKKDGMIISSAETAAETKSSAMVVGVATDPKYRGRGYSKAVLNRLCHDLIKERKSLCLFYDNPDAGKIYKELGFKNIGKWSVWNM